MNITVECYAGYRGEESPRHLVIVQRRVEVRKILDRWLDPQHRYFKILGSDDGVYMIRHDTLQDQWSLVYYHQKDTPLDWDRKV